MIPTLILFGLIFGRWWRSCLIIATVGWPAALFAAGVMEIEADLVAAAAFALTNTAVGVLIHQGVLWLVRRCSRRAAAV